MKKFYPSILALLLVSGISSSFAQTFNSIAPNPANYTFSNPLYWQGGVAPSNPCNNCAINMYSPTSINVSDGADIKVNGGTVNVYGNTILTINTYIEFNNVAITIGNDPTTPAGIELNDQVDLDGTSSVRLANNMTYINTNNTDINGDFINDPVTGPHVNYSSTAKMAGLFAAANPATNGGYDYTFVLSALGVGSFTTTYPSPYTINCNHAAITGLPHNCVAGYVFGPAQTGIDPAKPGAGLVFLGATTLPVELVQFLATQNTDGTVKVIWATAQEVNAGVYEVERSDDKGLWLKIGTVKANGNSSVTSNYHFTDATPTAGTVYYRLKMVDLDGQYKYSPVAVINGSTDGQSLVIYSNPFVDQIRVKVNVKHAQTLSLTVSDMMGRTYVRQSFSAGEGDNLINLVPKSAASGTYILKIHGSSYDQTVKMMKQ